MAAKRCPLPKRFSAALSEKAYARLRSLNTQYGYGNNYLLTVLLENFDETIDKKSLNKAFEEFKSEYGAPKPVAMKKGK